jgi:hypothetical protein
MPRKAFGRSCRVFLYVDQFLKVDEDNGIALQEHVPWGEALPYQASGEHRVPQRKQGPNEILPGRPAERSRTEQILNSSAEVD